MADWNWFFSSLAQSIAAIVGILGAFAITSLVSNQADFKRQLGRGHELLARSQQLADALSERYFNWYNKHSMQDLLDSVASDIQREHIHEITAETLLERHPYSPFVPRDEVLSRVQTCIAIQAKEASRPRTGFEFNPIPRSIVSPNLSRDLQKEREAIDGLIVEVRHNTRLASQYLGSIDDNPEDSPLVRFAIAACITLFLGGVIYPLSFLPAHPSHAPTLSLQAVLPTLLSLRGAFLSFTSVVFLVLCAAFVRLSRQLRYPTSLLEPLRPFQQVGAYSEYLAIMVANEAARPKSV